jgi:hypothetical protein
MAHDDDDDRETQRLAEAAETESAEEKRVYLDQGRSLAVSREGAHQVVDIRAASGQLELRVKLTEEGPVLVLEGVKVQVHAAESFDIKCREFNIEATESTVIASKGELKIKADGELDIDSPEDIHIRGKVIWLN